MTTLLSIIIAGSIPSIVGFIWYHPRVFGGLWMRTSGLQPGQVAGRHGASLFALLALLLGFMTAYGMFLELRLVATLATALMRASILFVAFMLPVVSMSFLWERKPLSLYLATGAYWLVSLLLMTVVLFYLR